MYQEFSLQIAGTRCFSALFSEEHTFSISWIHYTFVSIFNHYYSKTLCVMKLTFIKLIFYLFSFCNLLLFLLYISLFSSLTSIKNWQQIPSIFAILSMQCSVIHCQRLFWELSELDFINIFWAFRPRLHLFINIHHTAPQGSDP